jgi:hypothetical protein
MELKIMLAIAIIVACVFLFPQKIFSQQQNQTTPTVSGNAKSILNVPSNLSRIEITLKNDQSSQKSFLDTYMPIISAVVGTSIGSFVTYFRL